MGEGVEEGLGKRVGNWGKRVEARGRDGGVFDEISAMTDRKESVYGGEMSGGEWVRGHVRVREG